MFSCFAQMEYGVAIVLAVIMDANKHQLVTELNVTAEMVIFYIPMEKHALVSLIFSLENLSKCN